MAYPNDEISALNTAFLHSSITTSEPLPLQQPPPTEPLQEAYKIRESDLRTTFLDIKTKAISERAYQSKDADLQNALQRIKILEANVRIYHEDSVKFREAYNNLKIKYRNLKASVGTTQNGVERVGLELGCKEENGKLRKEVEDLKARFEKFEDEHKNCIEQGTAGVYNVWRTTNECVEGDERWEGRMVREQGGEEVVDDNAMQLRLGTVEKQIQAMQDQSDALRTGPEAQESSYSQEKGFQYRKLGMEDLVKDVMGQNKENLLLLSHSEIVI